MAQAARMADTPVSVRFGRDEAAMYRTLRARARASKRSLSEQIKYYAHLGMIAADSPDLPLSFIEGILEAQEELRVGLGQPYRWGVLGESRVATARAATTKAAKR